VTVEDVIAAAVAAKVVPLVDEVRRLVDVVTELRRILPSPLVTIEQAAEATGLSVSTIRRGIKAGTIPARKIGRSVRVDLAALKPLTTDEVAGAARAARRDL